MRVGAALAAAGVVLGAFGSHGLADRLSAVDLVAWKTAVDYQFIHALGLIAVGILGSVRQAGSGAGSLAVAGWSFLIGVMLFSGSLYLLALGAPRGIGPLTPVGGVAFVVGWLALLVAASR